jgi:hypothetical protein
MRAGNQRCLELPAVINGLMRRIAPIDGLTTYRYRKTLFDCSWMYGHRALALQQVEQVSQGSHPWVVERVAQ